LPTISSFRRRLTFFIRYGEGVVDQAWSIDRYFEFVLLLLFSTGLAFQVPILQALLGALGLVTAEQMFKGWRYVVLGAVVAGAILTPSTDPPHPEPFGRGCDVSIFVWHSAGEAPWQMSRSCMR
jgi:hypothetical protein